ncbi:ATP-dependent zinc metalloprotease FtsH [Geomonas nitrogeniifigens]|uniref:ATP-dependent zinc metalloprotease FtsH n=1 Tax=Geomonas diazotrophica TaxID=2843197 RepID=A0ABX8JVR1_9BACT|nr:ATP-dependent zinc metalloprotease FtsH [Geomonas nitrogeniifigens]QWV99510.1 ATP-dependent zinc metalloprotease FtsH [Geomonas nitrogeniifigens]QXE88685.1 ATP-dependent zinc metalloprotease FtsH [Geomonas nitrogeniifigens]
MGNTRNKKLMLLGLSLSFLAVAGYGFYSWQQSHADRSRQISYTSFIQKVTAGSISRVRIVGDEISAEAKNGDKYSLFLPAGAYLGDLLIAKKIDFSSTPPSGGPNWFEIGFLVAIGIFLFIFLRRFTGIGRSRARMVDGSESTTRFSDVAGTEEAKAELLDTVEFLKDPEKFSTLGGKMPTGVLLVGPPGTGKTLIARAVAGEADVPFFTISGSEFVEMYVGVGASRVRDLFAQAKKAAPCIVFIDEIDAVGRKRDASAGGGASDERDQTLNQLLVEMDGFEVNSGIVVLAATNRPEILDAALLRSGRFDRQVTVGSPDIRGREAILKVHAKNVPLHDEVDLMVIARGTPGFSGADLANVVNEAAILAARSNKGAVEMIDFDLAKDKVLMGAEKKSMVLSEKLKLSTAYHESGHVLVAKLVPGCDPVHKVTIIPRGRAMGVTVQIPEDDIYCYTKEMLVAHLKVLMGGRAAEELIYNTTTTGAGNDLARATDTARKMVSEWGMSRAFGPVAFGHNESTDSGGKSQKGFSDVTALEIDNEIRSIVTGCYSDVVALLKENMDALERLTRELVVKETLDSAEIDAILGLAVPVEETAMQAAVAA